MRRCIRSPRTRHEDPWKNGSQTARKLNRKFFLVLCFKSHPDIILISIMLSQSPFPFPRLPPEIRLQIYLWATPARVVHVQEDSRQDYTEYLEKFLKVPSDFRLDPSLAHFAHIWRGVIPRLTWDSTGAEKLITDTGVSINPTAPHQFRLETFGFTTSKPYTTPWVPTPQCPELSLSLLSCRPTACYTMMRGGSLYSEAPIPAFLHVCTESRTALLNHGYEPAFRTRSCGPQTWFCFEHDILYLTGEDIRHQSYHPDGSVHPYLLPERAPPSLGRVAISSRRHAASTAFGFRIRLRPNCRSDSRAYAPIIS